MGVSCNMYYTKALEFLSDHEMKQGVIILKGNENPGQSEAIDYLCSEWDYSAMTKDDFYLHRKGNN